jgi:hypothetical protein
VVVQRGGIAAERDGMEVQREDLPLGGCHRACAKNFSGIRAIVPWIVP